MIVYQPEFNSEKFRALMLYIADQSRDDRWFGAVKLNKILYYCDFLSFARHMEPITGASYLKMKAGPVPEELLNERRTVVDAGLAKIETRSVFRYTQQRLVPHAASIELGSLFDAREIKIIDEVLSFMKPLTAKESSEMAHAEVGWILAGDREVIPYETAWLAPISDVETWMMADGDVIEKTVVID